jgi:hypothetical protein
LAAAEGKLSLDDEVLKFFPDDAPSDPSQNLKAMRITDLLRMNTGHETEPPRPQDQSWKRAFLKHPVTFKPGTRFLYNTSATYMLAAIVEKATGSSLMEYLRPRLFEPLGIRNPTWEVSPEGIATGGFGLSVRTEDIAAFGQLYLRKGQWNGKQLVPQAWVEAATARQTSNGSNPKSDWDQGYGYQFWRCQNNCYRGDGAFGQYCIVMPDQDAVVAITSGLGDMQAVLTLVWDKLLPALKASPLPDDASAQTKLSQALKSLALRPQEGSKQGMEVSGKQFELPANPRKMEAVSLESGSAEAATLVVRCEGVEQRIRCGFKTWIKGEAALGAGAKPQPIAASGAWTADNTFTAKICSYETPFIYTLTLQFVGDEVRFNGRSNVGFGPTKEPELVGKQKRS